MASLKNASLEQIIEEINENISAKRASRLSRGNINVQRGAWVSEVEWKKRLARHAQNMQYLLKTLRPKTSVKS